MPYLIKGSAQEIYSAFNRKEFITLGTDYNAIEIDIDRGPFLGTFEELKFHEQQWRGRDTAYTYYTQGNIGAGNINILFGDCFPLLHPDDGFPNKDSYSENLVKLEFPYINKKLILCGLSLTYRKDKPDQWILGLIQNTNLAPHERSVFIITGFDPKPFCESRSFAISVIDKVQENILIDSLHSPLVQTLLEQAFHDNEVRSYAYVIELITRLTRKNKSAACDQLMEDLSKNNDFLNNAALRCLQDNNASVSTEQLQACLDSNNALHQALVNFIPSSDKKANNNKVALILLLHELELEPPQEQLDSAPSRFDSLCALGDDFLEKLISLHKADRLLFGKACLATDELAKGLNCFFKSLNYESQIAKLKGRTLEKFFSGLNALNEKLPPTITPFVFSLFSELLMVFPTELGKEDFRDLLDALTVPGLESVFVLEDLSAFLGKPPTVFNEMKTNAKKLSYDFSVLFDLMPSDSQVKARLEGLAKGYLQNPDLDLLKFLAKKNVQQIKAAYVLAKHKLGKKTIKGILKRGMLVEVVNILSSHNLESDLSKLIEEQNFDRLVIKINHKLSKNLEQREACLILLVKGDIKEQSRLESLIKKFNDSPGLASLIISLHKKDMAATDLLSVADNSDLQQCIQMLNWCKVTYNLEQLSEGRYSLINHLMENRAISSELMGILPALLKVDTQLAESQDTRASILKALDIYINFNQKINREGILDLILSSSSQGKKFRDRLNELDPQQSYPPTLLDFLFEESSKKHFSQEPLVSIAQNSILQAAIHSLKFYRMDFRLSQLSDEICQLIVHFTGNKSYNEELRPLLESLLTVDQVFLSRNKKTLVKALEALAHFPETKNKPELISLILRDSLQGVALRTLLNQIDLQQPPAKTNPQLLHFLYLGVSKGRQDTISAAINKRVSCPAKRARLNDWDERLCVINHLQELNIDRSYIEFAAGNNAQAKCFRAIVLRVDAKCAGLEQRLSSENTEKGANFNDAVDNYRKNLYQVAYDALNAKKDCDLKKEIRDAGTEIQRICTADSNPRLRQALRIITNILTIFLAYIPNLIHYRKCNDVTFFARPKSSETLKRLGCEIEEKIEAAMA